MIVITITVIYLSMVSQQHVSGKVIKVNNNGSTNTSCCMDGMCACSSLYNALIATEDNTVINITSHLVLLDAVVQINGSLRNITITGNDGVTIMCNNTGAIFCDMCSDITIEAITWNQCGNVDLPTAGGIFINLASNISIVNCIFQNFTNCIAVWINNPTGDINIIDSKFMFNKASDASLCGYFYSSLMILYATSTVNLFINNSLFYSNGGTEQSSSLNYSSLWFYSNKFYPTNLSILINNTRYVSNSFGGVYINAVGYALITLDNVNVSGNNQGVQVLYTRYRGSLLLQILSSYFSFNTNALIIKLEGHYISVRISNTTFANNQGNDDTLGTAMYALLSSFNSTLSMSFCSFLGNIGGNTIAQFYAKDHGSFINLFMTSTSFVNNEIGSPLHLTNCILKFYSSTLFQDNSAKSGAAIYISERSQISVDDESTVQFINNTASLRGGAIYIDLTNCYDHGIVFTNFTRYDAISFINNSAKLSGNSIYFDIPDSCDVVNDYSKSNSAGYVLYKFNYTQSHSIIGPPISTSPYEINLCSPAKCGFNSGTICVVEEQKMLGQPIYFNATVCGYFSAVTEATQFQVDCVNCEYKYKLLENKLVARNASRERVNILSVAAATDVENDTNIILIISSLPSSEYKQLTATLSLTLSSCFNGFLFSEQSQQCECQNKDGYVHCEEDNASIKLGYWFGVFSGKHTFSLCHNEYCNFFTLRKETRSGFYNLPAKVGDQCNLHRTGVACGQCSEGYTLAYNSPECISIEKCSPGMIILVVVLTVLYWTTMIAILFGITYYFTKVSLGYLYGIMYFYSTVDILLASNLYSTDEVFYTVSVLSSLAKLNPQFLGRLCFCYNLDVIDQQFIHYCHAVFVSVTLIGILITTRRFQRITFYIDHCIAQVVCLLLLLSYPSVTSISLLLLRPINFDKVDGLYTYLSPHIKYFSTRHTAYASVAILCGILVTIGFPLSLLLGKLITKLFDKFVKREIRQNGNRMINHRIIGQDEGFLKKCTDRIKLILVTLQDCYKDQYRWFAAYYLICRLVIMLITYYANDDYNNMIYYLQTACVVIAMTHIWIQPYKDDILNAMDTVILLIMLLIVNLRGFSFSTSAVSGITVSLVIAPLLLVLAGMAVTRLFKYPVGTKVKRMLRNAVRRSQQRRFCCNAVVDEERRKLIQGNDGSSSSEESE